jgi:hypothetical protein
MAKDKMATPKSSPMRKVASANMGELTKMVADPKTPEPVRKAAQKRLDRISSSDRTFSRGSRGEGNYSKGGDATKKDIPVIAISIGMGKMKEPKKTTKMMRGGMSGGKEHMYAAGGMVKDNPGLKALKAASPEAHKKITGK